MTSVYRFKVGKTSRAYTRSNGLTKNKTHFESNKIISVQKGRKEIQSVREFFPTHMIMTMTCDGLIARRRYRATGYDDSMFDEKRCCVRVDNDSLRNNLMY